MRRKALYPNWKIKTRAPLPGKCSECKFADTWYDDKGLSARTEITCRRMPRSVHFESDGTCGCFEHRAKARE